MSVRKLEPGRKGSQKWMRYFANEGKDLLNDSLFELDSSLESIEWLYPLKENAYKEPRLQQTNLFDRADLKFWPERGPVWDAVARFGDNGILLVEAKAHTSEPSSVCGAKDNDSKTKIVKALGETFDKLSGGLVFGGKRPECWMEGNYQLANRLAFLHHLDELKDKTGMQVRLLLLYFIGDTSHKPTTREQWEAYREKTWLAMLGKKEAPPGVIELFLPVPSPKGPEAGWQG